MPMNTRPVTGELDGLLAFLDHQREAVRYACFGLAEHMLLRLAEPQVGGQRQGADEFGHPHTLRRGLLHASG